MASVKGQGTGIDPDIPLGYLQVIAGLEVQPRLLIAAKVV